MTEQPADDAIEQDSLVPDEVLPSGSLPHLRYRDLPEPTSWRKMLGPSILLAGLALGSGEFVLWPYITSKVGFVFFWACMIGVITQFFLNMEIERWTLATGETAITGFCRISRHLAWLMLILNILPWAWPGWATGAGTMLSWLLFGAEQVVNEAGEVEFKAKYVSWLGIAGLWIVGAALTLGPVVYNTVEKIQIFLVGLILLLVVVLGALVIRGDAVTAMVSGITNIGQMPDMTTSGLSMVLLLGALAFAGAGGTTNLGQSNYIRDKGYGMGRYIGRITSPITGQQEATEEIGYHFPQDEQNLTRWRAWWRAANIEHLLSFFVTCVVCLCLMSLITYSLFYDAQGELQDGMGKYGNDLNFIWGQAEVLKSSHGGLVMIGFMIMGIAILLTTELGVLDAVARISADIVKVNYLSGNARWSQSRLYFCFLWGEILLGTAILLIPNFGKPLFLLKTSAAMNGGVMFIYSILLLYMNKRILRGRLSMGIGRTIMIAWSILFFGFFTTVALAYEVIPTILKMLGLS